MTNNYDAKLKASTQEQESVFASRMIRVLELQCILIEKDRLSFFKGDPMLLLIRFVLSIIPCKAHHNYIIITL